MKKATVVITTCNRHKDLLRCIKSLSESTFKDFDLIIIDDYSSDDTKHIESDNIAAMFGLDKNNIRVEHNNHNFKMVKSRNLGAKLASGEYVVFIDDDNIIDSKMIEYLIEFADKNQNFGIFGPSMYYWSNKQKYLDAQKINFFTGKTDGCIDDSSKEFCYSDGVPNVFMIRKKVFEVAGYFDEALMQTFTEPDFSFNAKKYGFEACIVKAAITYHDIPFDFSPRTLGGQFKAKAYCTMRNRALIIMRYGKWYHQIVYAFIFSWMWFLIYSGLILRFARFDLVKLYFYGWRDGIIYFFTRRLINSLPKIL